MKTLTAGLWSLMIASSLLVQGCASQDTGGSVAPLAPLAVEMGPGVESRRMQPPNSAEFTTNIDNPYFPLVPGTVSSFAGLTKNGMETGRVEVTHDTKTIQGVATRVVHDQVFADGNLIEDTIDWYAQDKDGNVWYFGEDSKQIQNGQVVGTEGSWESGKDGAERGIQMLAHPKIGVAYSQEYAAGVAEDQARVVSLTESASVPYGSFENCVKTMEWTPLARTDRAFKFYAPGVGVVLEVASRERVELTAVSKP